MTDTILSIRNVSKTFDAGGHFVKALDDVSLDVERGSCVAIVGEGPGQRILEALIEPLEPISTVGSGDAFVAGYIAALYDGGSPEECLAYGVACGAESTQHLGAGRIDRGRAESLLGNVEVRQLQLPAEV